MLELREVAASYGSVEAVRNVTLTVPDGSTVALLGRDDASTAPLGDVVVLAVPHAAVADVVATRREDLAGTIVVDITNPVDFETFDGLTVPADSSATAGIAAALPDSHVLKAFNTTFAATLATKQVGPNPTTVLIAGDDTAAKGALAAALTAGGVAAIDAGGISRARELEALGLAPRSAVVDGTVVRMPKAYPIYDSHYRGHLDVVRASLDAIPNLHTVGRNGMHKYNNQDHSMYTAMLAV